MAAAQMRISFDVGTAKRRFALTFRERLAEWGVAAGLALWGLLAFNSPGLFQRPYFQPLASANYRAGCCAAGSLFWLFLLVGSVSVEWRSPGAAMYSVGFLLTVISGCYAAGDYHRASYIYSRRPLGGTGIAGASS